MGESFPIEQLDYDLPAELIAQEPLPERDASRLLVLDRARDSLADVTFRALEEYVNAGDLLVLNDTRVVPARFVARRATGGRVAGLYLQEIEPGLWEVLLTGSGRLRVGEELALEPESTGFVLQLAGRVEAGRWRVRVSPVATADQILARVGQAPLPPYIRRSKDPDPDRAAADCVRYQTVYAARPGAVAAPTAGLHFTDELLQQLEQHGIVTTRVTLHVGLGTFEPIQVDDLARHRMHSESYELPTAAAEAVRRCRQGRARVVAVGTTSLRVLESCADEAGGIRASRGWTELFCYPPYRFRVVDALLTNFHLPRSTLLALVMAFAGVEQIRRAYRHAIAAGYRFYSYGDAMLIL
ncbi:MAG TPA: tRNA preQ1(34) S-adenosylmethionine ribosyltransferase-isomerase QueA [Phycisphaerae bacterium]|nr:tRNA preQ1(34) S-adenosylmethionine ribosyltransferase-isomerase QueA [Phycisphaerae bacterium]